MDDLISRREAIDAVHKEFDECLVWDESGKHTADEVERVLADVPSAVVGTQMSLADCISRESAIDAVCEYCEYCEYFYNEKVIQSIKEIPSAQPDNLVRPSARWMSVGHKKARICSRCFGDEPYKFADYDANVYGFCPHCGAKMELNKLPSAQPVDKDTNVPANDLISRQAAKNKKVYSEERHEYVIPVAEIDWLPSAQPYTEEEIQAMQDLEQAQLDKAYQIGVEEGLQSAQPEHTETHECDYQRTETHDSRREWYMKGYRDAQPKWTPVSSESMPEDGVTVWVTIKGHDVIRCEDGETLEQAVARISKMRRVSEGFWCEDDKTWYNAGGYPMMVQPIAWMPIDTPEPWQGR